MAISTYEGGIADSGLSFFTNKIKMSGQVWYVSSTSGTDDAGWGTDRQKPLATLAQAQTNAADDDVIVCLSLHAEILTAVLAITKRLTIVGEGGAAGAPSVTFQMNSAANAILFSSSAISVSFRNIKFKTNLQTSTGARLSITGGAFKMRSCYFECSGTDEAAALSLGSGADNAVLRDNYFVSTATTIADQPESGLKVAAAITNLSMEGNVFDDGTVGFSSGYAFHASTAAITRLEEEDSSYLRGAGQTIHASTTRWSGVGTNSGRVRRLW